MDDNCPLDWVLFSGEDKQKIFDNVNVICTPENLTLPSKG